MASLQARHSKSCALGSRVWTKGEPDARAGCTCSPTFYLVASLKAGGRNPVGKSYSIAKKALTQAQAAQDRGDLLIADNRTFTEWADAWVASLEGPKATTLDTYAPALEYAKRAFGTKRLRKLTVEDVREFLALMPKLSGSTRKKHLGTLSRCLQQAVREGKLASNPVERLGQAQ